MNQPILIAEDLTKTFGEIQAVRGVSFQVAGGEIFSLLGPNGAGKTTTINMLSGLLTPGRGRALIAGSSVVDEPYRVKEAIGVVPQEIALYPTISARENLAFWGRMYGLNGDRLRSRIDAVLEVADLKDRAAERVETYSGGMKRRLNIAVGLLHEPRVLFLDEPTVGIDPQSRRRILDTIKALNQSGLTVLYTTHYMEEAEELSHRIAVMDHGEIIATGTLGQLTQLVGGQDTLRLDLDSNGYHIDELIESLDGLPHVTLVAGERDLVSLQSPDANLALPGIIDRLSQRGVQIRRLEIQEPDLEAVFLHLTGRALRD